MQAWSTFGGSCRGALVLQSCMVSFVSACCKRRGSRDVAVIEGLASEFRSA